jgi:hypothetical protein
LGFLIRRSHRSPLDSKSGLIWKTEWPISASTDLSLREWGAIHAGITTPNLTDLVAIQ